MKLSDVAETGRLDPAVRKTIEAYLQDLGETDLAVHLEQPPSPATPAIPYGVIVAVDSGLFVFSYSLPEGGGCEVAGTLTPWHEVRVAELTMRTDLQPDMIDIPRMWTLSLNAPNLTMTASRDGNADLIAIARVCLERTITS
ncbi:MAG: hypothetical protein M3452_11265 [Chloroflexota bacterium]|nr:hypothetical protein [Chloroflexota bacterium]